MTTPADSESGALDPRFVKALTDVQFDLYAFICMLLGNRDAAQDVLQDTNLSLMRHAAEYNFARPFWPWAKAFAYNHVRTCKKAYERTPLIFDNGLIDMMAEEYYEEPAESRIELDLLDECMEKLTPSQRRLIEARYYCGEKVESIAARLNKSAISVYVQIHRIRKRLEDCIDTSLTAARANGETGGHA